MPDIQSDRSNTV